MPNIQVSDDQFRRLSAAALAAGFQDVSALVAYFAEEPVEDPRGSLNESQLRKNVAVMERGDAEVEAGGGQEMKNAIREIADKYGLDVSQ